MSSVELCDHPASRNDTDSEAAPHTEHQLEPTDRGRAAWRLLGLAFVFESFFWGELSFLL
jgi:hypothetical protein